MRATQTDLDGEKRNTELGGKGSGVDPGGVGGEYDGNSQRTNFKMHRYIGVPVSLHRRLNGNDLSK